MKGFLITTSSHQEEWLEHIVTGFYIVVFTITIITNAFLFTVFFRNKSFRDLSTFLLVQMAGADVLYLCITGSIVAVKNLEIELTRSVCKTLLYFEGVCRFASSFSLLLISLERSISVCSPTLCYSIRNISSVKVKVFVTVFVMALILRLGVFFVACDSTKWAPGYRLAVTAATYILPLVIELVAYVAAYHKIQQRIRNSSRSKQVLLFIRKSLKVFVLIVVVFAVCTLPSSILVILQSLRVNTPSYFLGYVVDLIECLPCVTNVICYLVCSPKFRSEIKKLLSVRSRGKNEDARHSSRDDGEDDGNGTVPRSKMNLDIHRATMKLDWVLGDDPSQVEIPKSPPATDKPSFEIPSTLEEEKEEMELPTIEEKENTFFPNLSRKVVHGTWPRTKQTLLTDSRLKLDLANVEPMHSANKACDITDSGLSRSGSELDIDSILDKLAVGCPSASEDSEKVVMGPRVETTHAPCHQVIVRVPVDEGWSERFPHLRLNSDYLNFSELYRCLNVS